MKIHWEKAQGQQQFTGYGENYVIVNGRQIERSLIVLPDRLIENWPVADFEALGAEHFAQLAELGIEIAVLGTGSRMRFPHPRLTAALAAKHIGFEVMDNHAACRTYNILLQEGRVVAAALILG